MPRLQRDACFVYRPSSWARATLWATLWTKETCLAMQGQRVLPEEGTATPRPAVSLLSSAVSEDFHLPQTLLFKSLQGDQFYL